MSPPRISYSRPRSSRPWLIQVLVFAFLLLLCSRWIASFVIEYQWWNELGQLETWFSLWLYGVAPVAVATAIAFAVLLAAHAYALRFAETRLRDHRIYGWLMTLVLVVFGVFNCLGDFGYVDGGPLRGKPFGG